MSDEAERFNRGRDRDNDYEGIDDFPADYEIEDDVVPDSMANGGTESDDEMGDGLQQLNLVESAQGPGIHIHGAQVSQSNIHDSQDSVSIIQATPVESNTSFSSANESQIINTQVTSDSDPSVISGTDKNVTKTHDNSTQGNKVDTNTDTDTHNRVDGTNSEHDGATATPNRRSTRISNNSNKNSELATITATGAKPKTQLYSSATKQPKSTNAKSDPKSDASQGTRSIKTFLVKQDNKGTKFNQLRIVPNVVDWFSNPKTGVSDSQPLVTLGELQPRPRRESGRNTKRARINSPTEDDLTHSQLETATSDNGAAPDNIDTRANTVLATVLNTDTVNNATADTTPQGNREANTSDKAPDNVATHQFSFFRSAMKTGATNEAPNTNTGATNPVPVTNTVGNTNPPVDIANNKTDTSRSVVFQDEQDSFLPMDPNAVPFYKRARGCNCAEAKAVERANALDEMADSGKPPRWAYGLAPYPNYMGVIAESLTDTRRRHALELARATARALRSSSASAAEQARLNWQTVSTSYNEDSHGADRAEARLVSMTNKEREKERHRLTTRVAFHLEHPVQDDEISRHFNNQNVPVPTAQRGNRANDQADNNDPNNGESNNVAPDNGAANMEVDQQVNNNRPRQYQGRSASRQNGGRNNANGRPRNRSRSRSPFRGRRQRSREQGRDRSRNRRANSRGNNRRGNGGNRGRGRNDRNFNAQAWGNANRDPNNQGQRGPNNPRDGLNEVIARVVAEFDRQRAMNNNGQ